MSNQQALLAQVLHALDEESYREWLPKTRGGSIGAIQFLSVMLWALSDAVDDAHKDMQIVSAWAEALHKATAWRANAALGGKWREVTPFDPVTYLAFDNCPAGWQWTLTVDNADDFLGDRSIGFRCSDVLAYWRGEPSPYSDPGPGRPLVADGTSEALPTSLQAPKTKGSEWSGARLWDRQEALVREKNGKKHGTTKTLAEESGLSERKIRRLIEDFLKVKPTKGQSLFPGVEHRIETRRKK